MPSQSSSFTGAGWLPVFPSTCWDYLQWILWLPSFWYFPLLFFMVALFLILSIANFFMVALFLILCIATFFMVALIFILSIANFLWLPSFLFFPLLFLYGCPLFYSLHCYFFMVAFFLILCIATFYGYPLFVTFPCYFFMVAPFWYFPLLILSFLSKDAPAFCVSPDAL